MYHHEVRCECENACHHPRGEFTLSTQVADLTDTHTGHSASVRRDPVSVMEISNGDGCRCRLMVSATDISPRGTKRVWERLSPPSGCVYARHKSDLTDTTQRQCVRRDPVLVTEISNGDG